MKVKVLGFGNLTLEKSCKKSAFAVDFVTQTVEHKEPAR